MTQKSQHPSEPLSLASADIQAGRRTCRDLLETCLARIEALEPEVHAWVVVDRAGAREQARVLDEEVAAGLIRGPLHGIPMGIKDIVDVAGLPTAAGFGPWKDHIAAEDAPLVARLRVAGAVIIGKTVTTPFAWIDPPPTRNPWDLSRTPGGSSSGSAAALACGMILGAVGSQTGGSITRPAAFCGVAGLKPSHGALPAEGFIPLAPTLDHPGFLAHCVADLAALWGAAGPRPTSADDRAEASPTPRLGRLGGFFRNRAEPGALESLDRALAAFVHAGCKAIDLPWPEGFDDILPAHRAILAAEAAAWHAPLLARHRDAYPPRIRALVEEGLAQPGADYDRALRRRGELRRSIEPAFGALDVVVVPAALGPAPDPSTTGDPLFNAPWSFLGLPTVSFPIGLAPDGLPLGIQFVGRSGQERELLAIAQRCETALRNDPASTGLGPVAVSPT